MEEKNGLKTYLYSFVFVLLIIAIVVMGYFMYKFYNEKITVTEEISKLKDQINNIQSNITDSSDDKYEEITNELDGIDVLYVTNVVNNNNQYTLKGVLYTQYTISSSEYDQIIAKKAMKLNNKNYIVKDNKLEDGESYALYEAETSEYPIYTFNRINNNEYSLESQSQITDVWKLTNEYRKITISGDTKCYVPEEVNDENYETVEDVFKDMNEVDPVESTNPDQRRSFTFKFENGKCVEVINELTQI